MWVLDLIEPSCESSVNSSSAVEDAVEQSNSVILISSGGGGSGAGVGKQLVSSGAPTAVAASGVVSEAASIKSLYLFVGQWTLGRQNCSFNFEASERSISRRHASVTVQQLTQLTKPNVWPQITLEDLQSRFGVYVNSQRIRGVVELQANDLIRLGACRFHLRLRYQPLIGVISRISSKTRKQQLHHICKSIGMHLLKKPSETATHCLMDPGPIVATVKVLWALVYNQPIISTEWLSAILRREHLSTDLPNYEEFLPCSINEDTSIYLPNPKRRLLFQHFVVIFLAPSVMEGLIAQMEGIEFCAYKQQNMQQMIELIETYQHKRDIIGAVNSTQQSSTNNTEGDEKIREVLDKLQIPIVTNHDLAGSVIFLKDLHPLVSSFSGNNTKGRDLKSNESELHKIKAEIVDTMDSNTLETSSKPSEDFPHPKKMSDYIQQKRQRETDDETEEQEKDIDNTEIPAKLPVKKRKTDENNNHAPSVSDYTNAKPEIEEENNDEVNDLDNFSFTSEPRGNSSSSSQLNWTQRLTGSITPSCNEVKIDYSNDEVEEKVRKICFNEDLDAPIQAKQEDVMMETPVALVETCELIVQKHTISPNPKKTNTNRKINYKTFKKGNHYSGRKERIEMVSELPCQDSARLLELAQEQEQLEEMERIAEDLFANPNATSTRRKSKQKELPTIASTMISRRKRNIARY